MIWTEFEANVLEVWLLVRIESHYGRYVRLRYALHPPIYIEEVWLPVADVDMYYDEKNTLYS